MASGGGGTKDRIDQLNAQITAMTSTQTALASSPYIVKRDLPTKMGDALMELAYQAGGEGRKGNGK